MDRTMDPDAGDEQATGEQSAGREPEPSRRLVLLTGVGALASAALAGCSGGGSSQTAGQAVDATTSSAPGAGTTAAVSGEATATTLAPTPECVDGDDATPSQTEGPYFKPSSPQRSDLRTGVTGTRLLLSGTVVTTACQPVARALVDVWQADDAGNYDNAGFRLRGHVFTDDRGRYQFDTIVPGLYPGRTRHIHVKAQAPNGPVLTTQLYFPGEAQNARDGIFRQELVMAMTDSGDGKAGTFTFVLR